ncbi:MAG: type II toxin-antitoxin system RelE/ParE family toxin [Ginsengibacter sp.]
MEEIYNILFSPEAEDESVKARIWYEEVQQGLGDAFRESLRIKIESLIQNPNNGSFIYKKVRSARMKKFPFNIIYRVSNFQIQVIAIFHHSRNPLEWKKRI